MTTQVWKIIEGCEYEKPSDECLFINYVEAKKYLDKYVEKRDYVKSSDKWHKNKWLDRTTGSMFIEIQEVNVYDKAENAPWFHYL